MSQPAEQRGRFCSVAPPAWNGAGTAAFILSILILPSYLSDRPSLSSSLAISCIVLAMNLTLAKRAMCRTERTSQWRQLGEITQLMQNMGRHTDMPPVCACSVSQISQSAGLLWAGCSKGNRRPKKRMTSCEVTMVTARPGASAAC